MERWYGPSSHLGGQGSPKHPLTVMCQPWMGDMQGRQILLQILCWLRFLIQCFSECIHSPTEIVPCALGLTIICLILNKMFGKHVSLFSCWKFCYLPASVPANVEWGVTVVRERVAWKSVSKVNQVPTHIHTNTLFRAYWGDLAPC